MADLISREAAIAAVHDARFPGMLQQRASEAIRALPAVKPAVKVKPLVWEAYEPGHPMKLFRAYCDTLRQEWIIWVDCPDVSAEKAQVEAMRAKRIVSALDVTPAPTLAEAAKVLADALDRMTDAEYLEAAHEVDKALQTHDRAQAAATLRRIAEGGE